MKSNNSSEINERRGKKPGGRKKAIGATQMMRRRMLVLAGVMMSFYVVVMGVMAWYQLVNREEWQQQAVDQQLYDTELPAKRGTVYDRNMETLVQSATAWVVSIRTDALLPEQRDAVVAKLSEITGLSPEYINSRIDYGYQHENINEVKLKNKIDKEQKDAIVAFMTDPETGAITVPGIRLTADTKRYYFRGTMAAAVLGFTNSDNSGGAGVESRYDDDLSGVSGRIVAARNAKNGDMPFDYKLMIDAQEGNSVVLTIDANIQAILEKYMRAAVEENNVQNKACGIIMNVNTGEVLAMATIPDFDPANYAVIVDPVKKAEIDAIVDNDERTQATQNALSRQWTNKAISESYEPGSVFKPVTMSAALEEGVTSINDSFYCPGYRVVGGRSISCHKSGGHGSESLTKGMMNSCNPVFMTLGERLGGSGFYKYFTAFGFTAKTGIDLPGEGTGVHHSEDGLNAHPADLAVSSFGQTNTVTPIQMITAIAAISNGGYLVQPHVVSQVLDSDGNLVRSIDTVVKRQVVSSETSRIINSMLEQTVSSGTAKNGYIRGYRIGGKTGTSEKIAEQAQTGMRTYVASYCAIAPSDDPEIAMLLLLDDPRGGSHMGGAIAAPVVRNVLSEVLPYLGVETIYSTEDIKNIDVQTPSVIGRTVEEATTELAAKGLKIRVVGNGATVVDQTPRSSSMPKGGTVVVMTDEGGSVPLATVPNVAGMSPSAANREITNAGLNIRYSGSGYDSSQGEAQRQDIPGGSSVSQGTVVTVEFIMGGATD